MDSPVSLPVEPAETRRQQLRQIRSGCSGCFVVVLLILFFIGGFTGLQHWLRIGTFGRSTEGLIVMGRPEKHADSMVWIGCFTLCALLFAMSARSLKRLLLGLAIVVGLSAAAIMGICYREFFALRAGPANEVELIYLWPRAAVKIDASRAVVKLEDEVTQIADTPTSVYYITIEVAGSSYRSNASGSVDGARRFLAMRGARIVP
jgi:hypothetical protein